MKTFFPLLVSVLFLTFSNQLLADRNNDLWQQFKAKKAMDELDAEFNKPAPVPEPVVVEKIIIEKVNIQPEPLVQPVPVRVFQPAPVFIPTPEPVRIFQPEPVFIPTPEPVIARAPAIVSQPEDVTVESDGYVFKLGSCKLTHSNIQCPLTVTSVEIDGKLTLYGNYDRYSSKLFDKQGNEYIPSKISMGNKSHLTHIVNKYISGVNAKGNIKFDNILPVTNSIAMIEISLRNGVTNKYKRIQFRNVNLSL